MDRTEWLQARRTGIGGSDVGAICGVSKFKTALEVYQEKTGELEPEDLSDNPAVYWGTELEDKVAEEYAKRTGLKVRRSNRILTHKQFPFMLANIDRDVVGLPKGLECKTSGIVAGWGEEGTDQVPEEYLLQCTHYLDVMDYEEWDLAVLILPVRAFKIYTIKRDDELIGTMRAIEAEFWERVESKNPPLPDFGHETTRDLLKRLYPGTNGEAVNLPEELMPWVTIYRDAKEMKKRQQAVIDECKNRIQAAMGDAAIGLFPDGTAWTRKLVKRKAYEVAEKSYIDLRFTTKTPKALEK